jgi:hypothetical protein
MLSVKTLLVLTIITTIICSHYYVLAAARFPVSSESLDTSESLESHQRHRGSQFNVSQPQITPVNYVSRVMSVVTTKWRQYNNIRDEGTMYGVNRVISDMTQQCAV